ncbi:little elongation complex subunit 1 [Drosophila nasuta]|uniref:little elongation complex subunit 1 n=1 Tax=Drosophila nasuta TaxID=42062 RepID=UPI00295EC874|nr:little elongation complex subunit 1 [Drosophila nasuta]
MPENLDLCEIDFLLGSSPCQMQNEATFDLHVPGNRKSSKKRSLLAERIADSDELVRQLKQLQGNQQQLNDLRRSAGEVTELYQHEKQQREELERRLTERNQRCSELEKQLDVQQLNSENLQEQLKVRALPVDAKDMVTIFMQLTQRVGGEDSPASGLLRREQNLMRKLKEYCKTCKIVIPPAPAIKSPPAKRSKATCGTAIATQATQPNELPSKKPEMCSIAVQSENVAVATRNQGTQHKYMTTTRGTTTASFIKKHDVGTCFPEPKAPLSVQQILSDMLTWSSSSQRPLSPIGDLQPEPDVVSTISLGTCTDLCNVLREIDYLPAVPADLKRSTSRPPSRASVKDELPTTPTLGAYGHHMAKELLNILPHNQSVLTDLPPHVFNEIWQVMGQMVLVVLQRRSTNAAPATPTPTPVPTPPPTISQADFSSWFDALHESSLNLAMSSNKDHAEIDVPAEEETVGGMDIGTDPIIMPPPNELTPIKLPVRPKFRMKSRIKPKPKKKKRRVVIKTKSSAKKQQSENDCKTVDTADSAVYFLSNLNVFKSSNCDILDIQLDPEEQRLLEMTSATEAFKQTVDCQEETPQRVFSSTSGQSQINENSADKENILQKPKNSLQSTSIVPEIQADNRQFSILEFTQDRSQSMHTISSCQNETQPTLDEVDTAPSHLLKDTTSCILQSSIQTSAHNNQKESTAANEKKSYDGKTLDKEVPTEKLSLTFCQPKQLTKSLVEIKEDSVNKHWMSQNTVIISPHREKVESTLNEDKTSKDEESSTEDHSQCVLSASTYNTRVRSLFGSDDDSDNEQFEEDSSSFTSKCFQYSNQSESSREDWDDEQPAVCPEEKNTLSSTLKEAVNNSLTESDVEKPKLLAHSEDLQQCSPPSFNYKNQQMSSFDAHPNSPLLHYNAEMHVNFSDVESIGSGCDLVIDDGNLPDGDTDCQSEEPIQPVPVVNRKRKASSSSRLEYQPVEKRLTRSQAKQLLVESANVDNSNPQPSDTTFSSPMSPVAATDCEGSDLAPIEIPLQSPGEEELNAREPKALLSYVVNEVKAIAKQCGKRPQQQQSVEQLKLKVVDYMINFKELETSCFESLNRDESVACNVIINAYGTDEAKIENVNALERLMLVVRRIQLQNNSLIPRLMSVLEQRIFTLKERLNTQTSHKYLRLHLHLIAMQKSLTVRGQSFVNPARLLLAKILYHYKNDMTLLVLEVLNHFPTVLPYREERGYNHADPLITVIKHLLMGHKYEVQDAEGADRALISKLRFQYHFQPFEPTKQQVIENLVEKLKAGRLDQVCYAFALFCRRATPTQVLKGVLEAHLLPLANSYCDLCMQSEEYDARMEALLQSISMIVKQMPLGQQIDIINYIALFKRILVAVPRPRVQQAAVQAILRTQRFGYGFALDALQSYRPNYQLSPMTRAMMRSYAERRRQYQLHKKAPFCQKDANGNESVR